MVTLTLFNGFFYLYIYHANERARDGYIYIPSETCHWWVGWEIYTFQYGLVDRTAYICRMLYYQSSAGKKTNLKKELKKYTGIHSKYNGNLHLKVLTMMNTQGWRKWSTRLHNSSSMHVFYLRLKRFDICHKNGCIIFVPFTLFFSFFEK